MDASQFSVDLPQFFYQLPLDADSITRRIRLLECLSAPYDRTSEDYCRHTDSLDALGETLTAGGTFLAGQLALPDHAAEVSAFLSMSLVPLSPQGLDLSDQSAQRAAADSLAKTLRDRRPLDSVHPLELTSGRAVASVRSGSFQGPENFPHTVIESNSALGLQIHILSPDGRVLVILDIITRQIDHWNSFVGLAIQIANTVKFPSAGYQI